MILRRSATPTDVGSRAVSHIETAAPYAVPRAVPILDIAAKSIMVLLLISALVDPAAVNLEGKAASARAVGYPLLAFIIPVLWYGWGRDRSFPWIADLMVTIPCFSDLLGNRIGLYDSVWWFDDLVHFVNTGLIAGAAIMLTLTYRATLAEAVERGLVVGVTSALLWEIAEYFAFLSKHVERNGAYADTLADMALGTMGSLCAALIIHRMWQTQRSVGIRTG